MRDTRTNSVFFDLQLEDLDVAFPDRTKKKKTKKSGGVNIGLQDDNPYGLTLSGLLNALDGVVAGEGKLWLVSCCVSCVCSARWLMGCAHSFFTTNHVDNLDPALLR